MEDGEKQKKHNDERQDEILEDMRNRGLECGLEGREKGLGDFEQKESIEDMPESSDNEPGGRILDTEDFKEVEIKQIIEQGGIRGIEENKFFGEGV